MNDKVITTIPKVEVIQDGQQVSAEQVNPQVMQLIFQAASTTQLVKLRKLEESKVPIGTKPIKRTVTDTIMKLPLYPPWISFSLINGSGGALSVWINDETDPLVEAMIAASETYSINMYYPIIRTLFLKAESGGSTEVRIYGKEGKPI